MIRLATVALKTLFSFEMTLSLFLFAGTFKLGLSWFPVDFTLFSFLASVFAGIAILSRQKWTVPKSGLLVSGLAILWTALLPASLLWSPGVLYAQQKALYVSTLSLWSLLGTALIIARSPLRIQRFLWCLVIVSCWAALEASLIILRSSTSRFVWELGGSYLSVGRLLGTGLIATFSYAFLLRAKPILRLLSIGAFLWFGTLLLIVGARGPLLGAAISTVLPLAMSIRLNRASIRIPRWYPIVLVLIAVLVVGAGLYALKLDDLPTTLYRLQRLTGPDIGSSALARLHYYSAAYALWAQAPFAGHGVGSWPILMGMDDRRAYPHNIILELLVELGIMGALPFLIIAGISALNAFSQWSVTRHPLPIVAIMWFTFAVFNAMVSGDLHSNRIVFATIGLASMRLPISWRMGGPFKGVENVPPLTD